jgi:hypothetical protein
VETTAGDFSRGNARSIGGAARDAAQQAKDTASEEVQNLISDVEDLIDRVGEAADPEVRRNEGNSTSLLRTAGLISAGLRNFETVDVTQLPLEAMMNVSHAQFLIELSAAP